MSNESAPFVVKCQVSSFSIDGKASLLVYDNGKNILYEMAATQKMARMFGAKSYWWATMIDNQISVDANAKSNEKGFELYNYPTMNKK